MASIYNEEIVIDKLHNPDTMREAFGQVVEHYGERIYWQIRKMVVSHEDADDLLQNTFLKAWNNIELFRGEAKLSTWLYRIAVNETITFLNKERQRNNISIDSDDCFLLNNIESDPWFDGDELQLRLQKAIIKRYIGFIQEMILLWIRLMNYNRMSLYGKRLNVIWKPS